MIKYKTVDGATSPTEQRLDNAEAVRRYASIIAREAADGWTFECVRSEPVRKKAGDMAKLTGRRYVTEFKDVLVFRMDDAGASSGAAPKYGDYTAAGSGNQQSAAPGYADYDEYSADDTPLDDTPPDNTSAGNKAHEPRKGGKKTGIIIAAAILLVAAVCVLIVVLAGKSKTPDTGSTDNVPDESYIDESQISDDVDGFFNMAQGVWVSYADIDSDGDGNLVRFYFVKFANGEMQTGYYAGDVTNTGQVTEAVKTGDRSFNITVYYPAIPEEHLNGPRDEYWGNYSAELSYSESGEAQLTMYNDGAYVDKYTLFSKSGSIEEAADKVRAYLNGSTAASDSIQSITAACSGDTATLTFVDNDAANEMTINAHIGSNGITNSKTEGDRCTPAGAFNILYYIALEPLNTQLDFVQIRPGDVLVCDPNSMYYNTIQNVNETSSDWDSSQCEDLYEKFSSGRSVACIVFDYNGDMRTAGGARPNAGSDIFIDGIGSAGDLYSGYGDIKIRGYDMLQLLNYLDSSKDPMLVVR